jgi:hypothetical protein
MPAVALAALVDDGAAGPGTRFVAPATIRTRNWEGQQGGADRFRHLYPLGRVGEPEDVAAAVAFLASTDAAWITGHALPVDGGLLTGARPEFQEGATVTRSTGSPAERSAVGARTASRAATGEPPGYSSSLRSCWLQPPALRSDRRDGTA